MKKPKRAKRAAKVKKKRRAPQPICRECSGEGKIKCGYCSGSGIMPREREKDLVLGPVKCAYCNGKKYLVCNVCDGTGHLRKKK